MLLPFYDVRAYDASPSYWIKLDHSWPFLLILG